MHIHMLNDAWDIDYNPVGELCSVTLEPDGSDEYTEVGETITPPVIPQP